MLYIHTFTVMTLIIFRFHYQINEYYYFLLFWIEEKIYWNIHIIISNNICNSNYISIEYDDNLITRITHISSTLVHIKCINKTSVDIIIISEVDSYFVSILLPQRITLYFVVTSNDVSNLRRLNLNNIRLKEETCKES